MMHHTSLNNDYFNNLLQYNTLAGNWIMVHILLKSRGYADIEWSEI